MDDIKELITKVVKYQPQYKNAQEVVKDLLQIQPIDLTSKDTKMKDAMDWGKEVVLCLYRARNYSFSKQEAEVLREALDFIGALPLEDFDQIAPQLTSQTAKDRIDPALVNDVAFPVFAAGQFRDEEGGKMGVVLNDIADFWLVEQEYADKRPTQTEK